MSASGPVSHMNKEEAKNVTKLLKQYRNSREQTAGAVGNAMRGFTNELHSTQKLWKQGNKSLLIKVGLAMIAFPDPTISDVVGAALVSAGLIQMKMQNSALHVDDVYKTFPKVVKELGAIRAQTV